MTEQEQPDPLSYIPQKAKIMSRMGQISQNVEKKAFLADRLLSLSLHMIPKRRKKVYEQKYWARVELILKFKPFEQTYGRHMEI